MSYYLELMKKETEDVKCQESDEMVCSFFLVVFMPTLAPNINSSPQEEGEKRKHSVFSFPAIA